ncbi:MAG: DSD1 family PLP-dependent enzyme [Nitrospinae bacterium]|nr:DSD1 family PLP-dependent enzyme [Nitrospinota bacterium]
MPYTQSIGTPVREIETPALLVDLDVMEENLALMAKRLEGTGMSLRAHAKTHKSPWFAKKQIALGAVGVCCQKVSEAEVMVGGGVENVLVSSEITAVSKLKRLAALARHARLMLVVDHPQGVAMLAEAVTAAGAEIDVLVDVEVGHARCGVEPGEPAVELARRVEAAKGLELKGIQAYHGWAQHVDGFAERREVYAGAIARMRETVDAFEAAGLPLEIKSGGGTGSWRWDVESGVLNELQAGSYLFMDSHYLRIGGENSDIYDDFKPSLFVLTTVVSSPVPERVVVDAGHKALASDSGLAPCLELEGAVHTRASDEHGMLELSPASRRPEIGETLLFQPSHCDPTINLYDVYHGVRGGMEEGVLEAVIPVAARGCVW